MEAGPSKEDEGFDVLGDDGDDEEAEQIKAERVAGYDARKANKPKAIAKARI